MEMFLVGGIVRDMLLGVPSKDHDFSVVMPKGTVDPFGVMRSELVSRGVEIFVETPAFLCIRGRFSAGDAEFPGVAADFVLARKDSTGSDGRRPDFVEPGTLMDDLARRDFTVNAMAMRRGPFGETLITDPFNGRADLVTRSLRFVGVPEDRIREDALRVMRALRFVVTKGFVMTADTVKAISDPSVPDLLASISEDRRSEELSRMFRFDTIASLDCLSSIPTSLRDAIFSGRVRLDATLKG